MLKALSRDKDTKGVEKSYNY